MPNLFFHSSIQYGTFIFQNPPGEAPAQGPNFPILFGVDLKGGNKTPEAKVAAAIGKAQTTLDKNEKLPEAELRAQQKAADAKIIEEFKKIPDGMAPAGDPRVIVAEFWRLDELVWNVKQAGKRPPDYEKLQHRYNDIMTDYRFARPKAVYKGMLGF